MLLTGGSAGSPFSPCIPTIVWKVWRHQMGNEEAVNRQNNGEKKKDKITNIDIQNITQNTNDRAKLSPTDEPMCSRRVGSSELH